MSACLSFFKGLKLAFVGDFALTARALRNMGLDGDALGACLSKRYTDFPFSLGFVYTGSWCDRDFLHGWSGLTWDGLPPELLLPDKTVSKHKIDYGLIFDSPDNLASFPTGFWIAGVEEGVSV